MELTPEQRQKIYEEEKARLALESLTPEARRQVYEEESWRETQARIQADQAEIDSTSPSAPHQPSYLSGIVVSLGLIFVIYTVKVGFLNNPYYKKYSAGTSPEVTTPLPQKSDEEIVQAIEDTLIELDAKDKAKVGVPKGWKWEYENDYDYVRGSVKNASSRTVSYWKVTARFLDKKGNIIDSDYTNSGETLLPGAAKRFEIMHAQIPQAKSARCFVEEVRFND